MRAVVFNGAGGNEVVEVTERDDLRPVGGEVLVDVSYAGVNPADVQQREGRYPAPAGTVADVPGLEVSGVVSSVGEHVLRWRPGDRVFGLVAGGGLASQVLVHERCVTAIPETLDDLQAAAVPEAFMTAHDAVRTQAALTVGETLVVHGANGGVGHAAVQIAATAGARVLAVARSRPDTSGFADHEGLVEWIDDEDFAPAVIEATGGRGADVIFETVGAVHFPANFEALAPQGRIVVVGVGAGTRIDLSLLQLMVKRASLRGSVLRSRSLEDKAVVVRAFERAVIPALTDGRITPVIDQVFAAEQATEAFDHLVRPGKFGKVLLDFR